MKKNLESTFKKTITKAFQLITVDTMGSNCPKKIKEKYSKINNL